MGALKVGQVPVCPELHVSFKLLQYDVQDGYATVTLNRPERRNALSLELLSELNAALWEADDDTEVRAVLLRGAGPDFCAGYDLDTGASSEARPRLRNSAYRKGGIYQENATIADDIWRLEFSQRLRMVIFDMHKPVVARIHGNCLAGGTDIALLCDILIAAEDARIGVPPICDIGTTPNCMWLYHLGPQWAKRLLFTGDTISGEDAAKLGLVLKAVPGGLLDEEVDSLMRKLGRMNPEALASNKRVINMGLEMMGARTLQRFAAEIDARLHKSEVSLQGKALAREQGIQALLRARRAKYPDNVAFVDRPELRERDGRLKK
jgi:enoyl-CoA hydratase